LYLFPLDYTETPSIEIDCETEEIIVSVIAISPWQILWDNGDTTNHTTYTEEIEAELILYAEPNCEQSFTLILPDIPKLESLPDLLDMTTQNGSTITIDLGLEEEEWSVAWYPFDIVNCDTCIIVDILPIEDTQMNIIYTHISGCTFESNFDIKIEKEIGIYVPNVFTPGGEEGNNEWLIHIFDSSIEIQSCTIFDRWGNEIYHVENSNEILWDGRFRGDFVTTGVYIYSLIYKDELGKQQTINGDITVLR